jgi:uncharacterized protein
MTPRALLLPTYRHMLRALSAWLEKAAMQRADNAEALLSARLAPDMFPLATQVRLVCVQALEGMARVRGEPLPPQATTLLDEGRAAEQQSGTMEQAQARIAETLTFLDSLVDGAGDLDPAGAVAHQLPSGMIFDFTADEYARDWAIAQFYFHLMTAYAILRNQGVALGKIDYVAHLIGNLRQPPAG